MNVRVIIGQLLDIMDELVPQRFEQAEVDTLWDKCVVLKSQNTHTSKEMEVLFELSTWVDIDGMGKEIDFYEEEMAALKLKFTGRERREDKPITQSQAAKYVKCPKVFTMGMFDKRKTGYVVSLPDVRWKDSKHKNSTDGGTKERSKSMLVRVAIIEKVEDDKGNPLTPVVIVPAEDIPMTATERRGIREKMLVKYAVKLKDKDLSQVEVVCSDFLRV